MKNIIIGLAVVVVLAVGGYFLYQTFSEPAPLDIETPTPVATTTPDNTATTTADIDETKKVIGKSAEDRDIIAYHYGTGETELLFVGGIHGGYEWNTVLVAFELMDYLEENPDVIPENVKVTVIPVLNPDGLHEVVGTTSRFAAADVPSNTGATIPGRFNGNNVDLNRNFDCDWQEKGQWQNRTVSGGSEAFSEPETKAIHEYVKGENPKAVVVWYSAAGGVFASSCHNDVSDETLALTNAYAKASGYPAHESFDFYAITGDMVNWLAKEHIPAISVLLTNHTDTEWSKNEAGVKALLNYYAE